MNIDWRRRMAASRREMLGLISTADREIVGIYQRAAEDLARKARSARAGGLTERWLKDYSRSLSETIDQMRLDIYGIVRDATGKSAQIPARDTKDWMARAMHAAGLGADNTFTSVLSRAPTDAIRSIIEGRMYRDGVSLSRRIWNNTGRLQHAIEDIVTQGLAQQASTLEIARALEEYLNPEERAPIDIRRLYPEMGEPARGGQPIPRTYQVEYNTLRLARTAINHAYWGANKAAANLNPLCQGMQWILSADHFDRQVRKFGPDVCDEYVKHDEGLGIGVYPVDKLPMPHPQCLCRQEQVLPTTDEAVERLNRWLAGGSDPALEQGYQRAQRLAGNQTVTTIRNGYIPAEDLPRISNGSSTVDPDVVTAIQGTSEALLEEYPILRGMIDRIELADEPDMGAFFTTYNPTTQAFKAAIRLDSATWGSLDGVRAAFERALASGHSKGVTDPMTILAHEYGHALHTALAMWEAGINPSAGSVSRLQLEAIAVRRRLISQDVFSMSGAFDGSKYNTAEAIYDAIEKEMGNRATHSGAELIAQAVAMGYNGTEGPICQAILNYLKGRMRRVLVAP
jgi:hypothetical protein